MITIWFNNDLGLKSKFSLVLNSYLVSNAFSIHIKLTFNSTYSFITLIYAGLVLIRERFDWYNSGCHYWLKRKILRIFHSGLKLEDVFLKMPFSNNLSYIINSLSCFNCLGTEITDCICIDYRTVIKYGDDKDNIFLLTTQCIAVAYVRYSQF